MKTLRQRLVQLSAEARAHAAGGVGDDDDVGVFIRCGRRAEPRFYGRARWLEQRRGSEEQYCEY